VTAVPEDVIGATLVCGRCKEQGSEARFDKSHFVELGLDEFKASCCERDERLVPEDELVLLTRDIRAVDVLTLDFEF